MPEYFFKRQDGKSTNYYVRLTAPTQLQKYLPRKDWEYRASTGTADRYRALTRGAGMILRKRQEWAALLATIESDTLAIPVQLTKQLIQQISGARLNSWIDTDIDERQGDEGISDEQLSEIEKFCKYSDTAMRSVLAQGKASNKWSDVLEEVHDWCDVLGYDIERTDPLFTELVREFAKAERTAQQIILQRNNGETPVLEEYRALIGTKLSVIYDAYFEHKSKSVTPKTVSKNLSIWQRFMDFHGDIFLDDISSSHIYRFLEDRLHTSNSPWSQGYVDGHGKRALKDIFALARTLGYMTAPNPVLALETTPTISKAEQKNREKPRYPFTSNQVNTLFASDWYNPLSKRWHGQLRTDLAVRYWAPLIAELHGARVREYLQLTTSDIIVEDGLLCFNFQVELENETTETTEQTDITTANKLERSLPQRSLKNESAIRKVPVHPKLLELGFAEFVNGIKERTSRQTPLFPSAIPDITGAGKQPVWGRAYEQGFVRYVRDTLGFGRGYGTHSARHEFEDRIRDCQAITGTWPPGLALFLTGRALPSDGDKKREGSEGSARVYGNGFRPRALFIHLAKIDFTDIVFPPPYHEWLAKSVVHSTCSSAG